MDYQIEALRLTLEQTYRDLKKALDVPPGVDKLPFTIDYGAESQPSDYKRQVAEPAIPSGSPAEKVLRSGDQDERTVIRWKGRDISPGRFGMPAHLAETSLMKPLAVLEITSDEATVSKYKGRVPDVDNAFTIPIQELRDKMRMGVGIDFEAPLRLDIPRIIDADLHVPQTFNPLPQQRDLVHGLDLEKHAVRPPGMFRPGVTQATSKADWYWPPDKKPMYVKVGGTPLESSAFCQARCESAFYNIARDIFGLDHFLPTVSLFQDPMEGRYHASIEHVTGEHYQNFDHKQHNTLLKMKQSGDLHKLAFMDTILGNRDRHVGNFLFTKKGLTLIDHGFAFEPARNVDSFFPAYWVSGGPAVPESTIEHVQEWLEGIDELALAQQMTTLGYSDYHVQSALGRLEQLRDGEGWLP